MKILEVEDLQKHFAGFRDAFNPRFESGHTPSPAGATKRALGGVSLTLSKGEALGVVGESGSRPVERLSM